MKNKIKNWMEKHERVCGVCMLCASLCVVAFGGAYLGARAGWPSIQCDVKVYGPDGITELVTE